MAVKFPMSSPVQRAGDDVLQALGGHDQLGGGAQHVEQLRSGAGQVLLDSQVHQLVDAMAAFAPPALGQTTLAPAMQSALLPVIAASWH